MDMQSMWVMLSAAIEATLPLILALISVDLMLGIFCAIKRGRFEWGKVGQFYQTMIVPYVGGYLVLLVAFTLLPDQLNTVLSPTLSGAALATILASLGASIMGHVKDIGFATPTGPPLL